MEMQWVSFGKWTKRTDEKTYLLFIRKISQYSWYNVRATEFTVSISFSLFAFASIFPSPCVCEFTFSPLTFSVRSVGVVMIQNTFPERDRVSILILCGRESFAFAFSFSFLFFISINSFVDSCRATQNIQHHGQAIVGSRMVVESAAADAELCSLCVCRVHTSISCISFLLLLLLIFENPLMR